MGGYIYPSFQNSGVDVGHVEGGYVYSRPVSIDVGRHGDAKTRAKKPGFWETLFGKRKAPHKPTVSGVPRKQPYFQTW